MNTMDNFEWIKSLNRQEMAEFINSIGISYCFSDGWGEYDPHYVLGNKWVREIDDVYEWMEEAPNK